MSVLVVLNGEAGALVLAVILGIVALLLNICSAFTLEPAFHMWWLPERGITVMAVRTSPYGTSGNYTYTDAGGTSHSSYRQAYASEIEISYHPDHPGRPVGVHMTPIRVLVALLALVLWVMATGLAAGTHSLYAKAHDSRGASAESAPVGITVAAGAALVAAPPNSAYARAPAAPST